MRTWQTLEFDYLQASVYPKAKLDAYLFPIQSACGGYQ
jgi:hypothetical protein